MAGDQREVLLVEDNPGDVWLISEGLRGGATEPNVHVVIDGEEAIAFLRREGTHAEAPRPDLVLLDLNLPKKDGQEVVEEIKTDPQLGSIPLVILTSSSAERDFSRCYELRANAYVTKPADVADFISAVASIKQFWLETVRLPSAGPVPPAAEGAG